MKKRMLLMFVGLIIIFGGIFGWYGLRQYGMKKYFASFTPPPQVVATTVAKTTIWQPYLDSIGSVIANNGVDISPEIAGQVKAIHFSSGDEVKADHILIQLEDASEQAQLKDIEAQLGLAQITLKSMQDLYTAGAATKFALDDAISKVKQFKANLENVKSNIDKKKIRAPFDGKIGIKAVNVGQFLAAGQTCTSLQSTATLHVKFAVAQQDLKLLAIKQVVEASVDTYPNETFKGSILAIDSKVDDNTRTIEVEAAIDNKSEKLMPGMFVNIRVALAPIPDSVVVPQTAVTSTLYGDSAFVVTLNGKKNDSGQELGSVKRIFIRTGDKQDANVTLLEGVKAGDIVVTGGQSKLSEGTQIAINNTNSN